MRTVFDEVIVPSAQRFKPDIILVSAGWVANPQLCKRFPCFTENCVFRNDAMQHASASVLSECFKSLSDQILNSNLAELNISDSFNVLWLRPGTVFLQLKIIDWKCVCELKTPGMMLMFWIHWQVFNLQLEHTTRLLRTSKNWQKIYAVAGACFSWRADTTSIRFLIQ